MERQRALPGLERYPEQPADALAGGGRARQRLPQPLRPQQRQYVRPGRPAALVRARRAARGALRALGGRNGHCRALRRQAAELAERRRRAPGPQHLVHRPALRHPRQLRGTPGRVGAAGRRVSRRPRQRAGRQGHGRDRRPQRPLLLARPRPAVRRRHRQRPGDKGVGRRRRAPAQRPAPRAACRAGRPGRARGRGRGALRRRRQHMDRRRARRPDHHAGKGTSSA